MSRILILATLAVLLCGCGESWDNYGEESFPGETEYHKCMREHDPVHRNVCRELR
jgi:hypothetical protein